MTPARAYEIASQWGSYMTSGDPGAVFYSFPCNDARPQNEAHRALLLAYTDECLTIASHNGADSAGDVVELKELRAFFAEYPLELDAFTAAYITSALWSTTDNADEQGGEPLDSNYSVTDIAPETLAKMKADCERFQREARPLLDGAIKTGKVKCGPDFDAIGHAGHDFWLTRNGHGAGFWDGDWPEPYGDELTNAAKRFSEVDLYVGDDKLIHS